MMKKASLSLSIEAIVILILAIVVMAFALPFIKDLFEKTKGGIIGQFPEVEIYATATDPIGIGNEFYIKPGQERKMTLQIYNNIGENIIVNSENDIKFDCTPESTDKGPITVATETIPSSKPLQSGDSTKIKVIFRGQIGMKNNDICKITVDDKITQSFFLLTQ